MSVSSVIEPYKNLHPFGVQVDESSELTSAIQTARKCQDLPFGEKLKVISQLVGENLKNGVEMWVKTKDPTATKILSPGSTLGEALKSQIGACRHQATLFFILGREAGLGDSHRIQATQLTDGKCCFNDVIHEGELYRISPYLDTLKDPNMRYDRSHLNPITYIKGQQFVSYKRDDLAQLKITGKSDSHDQVNPTVFRFYAGQVYSDADFQKLRLPADAKAVQFTLLNDGSV